MLPERLRYSRAARRLPVGRLALHHGVMAQPASRGTTGRAPGPSASACRACLLQAGSRRRQQKRHPMTNPYEYQFSPPPPPVARAPCSAPSIRDSHSQRPRRTVVRASTLVYTLYGRGLPDAAARGGYPAAVRASAFRESPAGCGAPRGREACRGWRGRCPVVQARTCAGGIRQPVRAAHR